jgi:hypothetical protein
LVALSGLIWGGRVEGASAALLGWSERGLNENDGRDYSIFALMPPYSTLHAQLVMGGKLVTSDAGITVTYEAVADARGSINTTSVAKGNFYENALGLLGVSLPPDAGIAGFGMPGKANTPQSMAFDPTGHVFSAVGIPLTPYDDNGLTNRRPMFRLVARSSGGAVLATTDIAVPVSDGMDCRACHASGAMVEARPNRGWEWECDPVRDYKLNILRRHDDHQLGSPRYDSLLAANGYAADGLHPSAARDGKAVLCLSCHPSNGLPGSGQADMRPLTQVMHLKHGVYLDPDLHRPLNLITNSVACLRCHAGPESEYVRGVHHRSAGADGSFTLQCQNCHGRMNDVASVKRRAYVDMPQCQACHTGTAVQNSGSLAFTSVFDATNHVRVAAAATFATTPSAPLPGASSFAQSSEHGGLRCAACHGPAHAETPTLDASEDAQSQRLQGAAGAVLSCAACHTGTLSTGLTGPHGTHQATQAYAKGHNDWIKTSGGRTTCMPCHGTDYRGTALSRARSSQTFTGKGTHVVFPGFQTGCYTCHLGPSEDDSNANRPPSIGSMTASTAMGTPLALLLPGADPDGTAIMFHVTSYPSHGTVSLSGRTATYVPASGFAGVDSFGYTAWDGQTDGNQATASITVTSSVCVLTMSATAPLAVLPGNGVAFRSAAVLSKCADPIVYDWDFGDGSDHSGEASPCHPYLVEGDYLWTLTATANGASRVVQGMISVSATLGPPVTLTITPMDFMTQLTWAPDDIPVTLEMSPDWTQADSWQPVYDLPFLDDAGLMNVQTLMIYDQQFYRLRRVP